MAKIRTSSSLNLASTQKQGEVVLGRSRRIKSERMRVAYQYPCQLIILWVSCNVLDFEIPLCLPVKIVLLLFLSLFFPSLFSLMISSFELSSLLKRSHFVFVEQLPVLSAVGRWLSIVMSYCMLFWCFSCQAHFIITEGHRFGCIYNK